MNEPPQDHTIKSFIEALQIFAKYAENGMDQLYPLWADHDEIGVYITTEQLPSDSDDGKRLQQLGWHIDEGNTERWYYFT